MANENEIKEVKATTVVEPVIEESTVEKSATVATKDPTKELIKETVSPDTKESEPLSKEDKVVQAIFEGAFNSGPLEGISSANLSGLQKCSTCKGEKLGHQSWADHNCTDQHVSGLVHSRGFLTAVGYLDQQYKAVLSIKCDLCYTNYKNILLYNCHKLEPEHRRRTQELLRLVQLAAGQGVIKKWTKISKPRKTTVSDLGRTISHFKHHNQRTNL